MSRNWFQVISHSKSARHKDLPDQWLLKLHLQYTYSPTLWFKSHPFKSHIIRSILFLYPYTFNLLQRIIRYEVYIPTDSHVWKGPFEQESGTVYPLANGKLCMVTFKQLDGGCCISLNEKIEVEGAHERAEERRLDYMFPKPYAYIGPDKTLHVLGERKEE